VDTNYTDAEQTTRAIPHNFERPITDESWNPINSSDMICA